MLLGQRRAIKKVLSELPNVPERVIYNYTVSKQESESFGISIVGGLGTLLRGIYVKSVSSHGACGKDGSIKVGRFINWNLYSFFIIIILQLPILFDVHTVTGRRSGRVGSNVTFLLHTPPQMFPIYSSVCLWLVISKRN